MTRILACLLLATSVAHADSCQPPATPQLTKDTVAKLGDLYKELVDTVRSQKDMDDFLATWSKSDGWHADRLATVVIGDGLSCIPDFCHAYVRVAPEYLKAVLDDALTRRLTDVRCSIMKMGGQLP